MHEDKYQNHFLNLVASREAMLQFARYTATAAATTSNTVIRPLAAPLQTLVTKLEQSVTARGGQDAQGLSSTRTQNDIITEMKDFVRDLNKELLQPKLHKRPTELAKVLPYGLSALTKANKKQFPVRFTVFADALEEQAATLGAEAGQKARAFLTELTEATTVRDATDKASQDTIGELGADWGLLCAGLWQVHCTALAQLHAEPARARAFFNYDLLPRRNTKRPTTNGPVPN